MADRGLVLLTTCGRGNPTGEPDLGEGGDVSLLQDQADVWMGDETATGVHHVRVPGLADRNLGHYIPDESQIHLGHGHPRIPSVSYRGNGYVRLGLVAEINRTEIRLSRLRLDELRLPREILLAPDYVHGQSGDLKLFLACRVEMTDLGDRWNVAKKSEIVKLPLL